jgi:hypothetical protein
MTQLEKLVIEWRDAQRAIDKMTASERQKSIDALQRLIEAHNVLLRYANEELG